MSRGNVGAMPGLAWTAALTTWFTLWPWTSFAEDGGRHFGTLLFCICAVTTAGILGRMARLPIVAVFSGQLLTVMLSANLIWGNSLFPTRGSVESVLQAVADAVTAAQEFRAPVPATEASLGPLIVLGGLLIHLLVDFLAVTLTRVPVAGLPLLAAYSLPISILDRQIGWLTFLFAATGFLGMLALQENDRVNRWGRALVADEDLDRSGFSVRSGSQHPAALGAWSVVAALLVPLLIPTFDLARLPGPGGGGGGDRTINIENPLTDMKQDLDPDSPDLPAVRVTTTAESPRYLRLAVLTEFSDITWRPGLHEFDEEQEAIGPLPAPAGLDETIPSRTVDWQLEYQEGFESEWLPTPMRLAAIEAGSGWRYDRETLDFHASEDDADTSGTSYSLTELDVDLDANLLSLATGVPGPLRERFTDLPSDLTPLVDELARQVTTGLFTQYDQAVALQRWFRTTFDYSLERVSGSGGDALEEFLAPTGRVGYCEQFASAMAVMARSLQIPARVAVGFLGADPVPGEQDVWEFSTRDMHAWPELYFEGVGWVIFEPTPAQQTGSAPAYTRGTGDGSPTDTPTTEPTSATTTAAPRDPNETQSTTPEEAANQQQEDEESLLVPVLAISAGVLVLLVLAALTPGWLRRRRTAARWAGATDPAESAWSELRDSVVDLGLVWPAGRSPRAAARTLARSFAAPLSKDTPVRPQRGRDTNPEAAAALDGIVAALEQSRYAPPGQLPALVEQLRAATELCVDALRAGVSPAARHRADWLPASLLRSRRRVSRQSSADLEGSDQLVDSMR